MADEDKTASQTQEEVEPEESTGAEETTEETKEEVTEGEEAEESKETKEETTEEEPKPEETEEEPAPSPRQNKAIERLTKKLAETSQQLKDVQSKPPQKQDQIIGEGDYDLDQINGLAQDFGQQRYNEGLAQANSLAFQTRLEIDAPRVAQKYEILDQNSDNFDPGRASFINELYLQTVGYDPTTGTVKNPNIRYEEFADGIMELVDTAASAKNADSSKNLAKQAAQTGVRPSGVAKKYSGDNPAEMSDDQLDEVIAASLGIKK